MKSVFPPRRQRGVVMVLVALAAAALVGFLGLTVDLGRLFVTKTELQSAMDACALAAAQELRPGVVPSDAQAINRAISAGTFAGHRNSVGFQSAAVSIDSSNILFSDRLSDNSNVFPFGYVSSAAANPATARYVMCTKTQGGIATWFMQVLERFVGATAAPSSVGAWAVATLANSQSNCAIPLGVCKKASAPASSPFQGLNIGDWMQSKLNQSATGSFDWIDFTPPGGGAQELANELAGEGVCNLPSTGTNVGEQGNKTALGKAWNTRFGLYKGSYSISADSPDYTGYAYTPTSWPAQSNAYAGTSGATPNFATARGGYMPYQGNSSGINLNGGYSNSSSASLQQHGANRRLVVAPVVDCSGWAASNPQTVPILGYACVLLLAPMSNDNGPAAGVPVWLEYRGRADDPASPCSTSGLAGGTAGPLVPVLVQ